jgi:antitoxin component of MazEF toxin-antitoxin module
MEEIRKVRKVGNSTVLSFHKKFGLTVGEHVKIRREDNRIIITRVEK